MSMRQSLTGKHGKRCKSLFLEQVVLGEIHRLTQFANEYEDDFIRAIAGHSAKVVENELARKHRELDALRARDKELDNLLERLYEYNVSGKINDDRFSKMSKRYEQEQAKTPRRSKHFGRNFARRTPSRWIWTYFLKQSGDTPGLQS